MTATATIGTWAIQAEDAPARIGRLIASAIIGEGVVDVAGDSFKVEQDTGSNMQIKVGSGTVGDLCVIAGDATADQGVYVGQHENATQTLAIAASDASDDRIDRVIARIYDDDADSSGNSYMDLEVLTGTPAGSPSAPAIPDGAISLATIEVDATVTAITNADITDTRAEAQIRSEAIEATEVFDPQIVTARDSSGSSVAIGTSYTLIMSVNLTIPSHWTGYDIEVEASCTLTDDSGGSTGSVVIQSKFNNPASGDFNIPLVSEMPFQNDHDNHPLAQVGFLEGQTASGNRTIRWEMIRTGNSYVADQIVMKAKAIRTS